MKLSWLSWKEIKRPSVTTVELWAAAEGERARACVFACVLRIPQASHIIVRSAHRMQFKHRSLQIMKTVLHNTHVCIILDFVLLHVRVLLAFECNK